MVSKPQYREEDLLSPSRTIPFSTSPVLVSGGKSNEAITAKNDVLRHIEAACLFESAPDAMMLVSREGRIAAINTRMEELFGYRREDLAGEGIELLMPAWFRNDLTGHRSRYGTAPQSQPLGAEVELFGRHRDGHDFPVEIALAPLETEVGTRISSGIRDVAELRRAQELQSSERFFGYIGTCTDLTGRKLSEQSLTRELKFRTLLAELSTKFIHPPADQIDGQIEEAQRCICEALGLDHSTLAQILAAPNDPIVTHTFAAEGLQDVPHVTELDLPWITQNLQAGRCVSFARIDDLPEEAATDKDSLRLHGPKSNVTFPLSAGGRAIGALAFGALRSEREWPAPIVECLGMAAQIFANALSRARADQDLRRAYGEIEELKQRLENENVYLREEVNLEYHHGDVIGDSQGIRRVLRNVEQVAPTDSTVLVLGETGTGKELIARTIHELSRRKSRVMVKVNCAALPAALIESELFGREKGAYTGALTREIGRFELAHGSTILLDELGELPLELQSKLLRVLQEGEFERLGSPKTLKVDVRVIAATSKNLQQAVRHGKFREDLFYRLNIFPITIPPLRERQEDIPPLVWHFVNSLSQRMGRSIETIHASTMDAFKNYYWPGNIRELRNIIERSLITNRSTVFRAKLPPLETAETISHSQTFEAVERNHLLHILDMVGWRVRGDGGAAQILGMKPTTLESRMQKLGISRHK